MSFHIKLRRKFLPRTCSDGLAFIFLLLILPAFYWFEVFVVLPNKYNYEFSVSYAIYVLWFTFLLINIVSNFTYLVLTDCSVHVEDLHSSVLPSWKFCDVCQCFTPPRSWHCDTCRTCILKRDHHCHFSACCIGHNNHRFFFMFLIYMVIATIHTTFFNATFVFQKEIFNLWLLLRTIFPLTIVTFGSEISFEHCYVIIFFMNVLGMLACSCLLIYHSGLMLKGAVTYEGSHKIYDYDLGTVKGNVMQVFGERWYWTWLSPFIESKLPSDGIHWDYVTSVSIKLK